MVRAFSKIIFSGASRFEYYLFSCPSNRAFPMPGTADGDAVSRCQAHWRQGARVILSIAPSGQLSPSC